MGWYGLWNIKYNGSNNEKFIDLAKMVIPNFRKRFDILENGNEIEAVKGLSWYTADKDIAKIMEFLGDSDSIEVMIDGETHPFDENDNELPFEKQTFKKENGKVVMESDYFDEDRYIDDDLGMRSAIQYQLENNEEPASSLEGGYTDTTYTYASWIATELGIHTNNGKFEGIKPELYDAYRKFIQEICYFELPENADEETIRRYNEFKEGMLDLSLPREYMDYNNYDKKGKVTELPECLKGMDKRDVQKLGGIETLTQLYEKSGEQKTIELLSILGYPLNAVKTTKKKSHFKKMEQEMTANTKIKQSVNDYLIDIIKKKYPSLSKENEEKFLEDISDTVDNEIKSDLSFSMGGFGPRGLRCDNRPSPELEHAFMSMDFGQNWDATRMAAAAHLTFPHKMSIHIEKGQYAEASDGYFETKYLYMTPEYKAKALDSVNKRIETELAKVPGSVMNDLENEYKQELEKYQKERQPYLERQEIEDQLAKQEEQLESTSNTLISLYAQRIDAVETLSISEEEKQIKKAEILAETEKAVKETRDNYRFNETKRSKLMEDYGWITLNDFDKEHISLQDEEEWMTKRIIRYAKEENAKVWEKFLSEPHEAFAWPDTSHLPSTDLSRYYAEKDNLESYKEESSIDKETQISKLTDTEKEIIAAFTTAYFEYVTKGSNYRIFDYLGEDENKQNLAKALQGYFNLHLSSVKDNEHINEFENDILPKIAEQYGFHEAGFGRNSETNIKFENGIIIGNVNYSKKVYYGGKDAIDHKISELESKIRFSEDLKNPNYFFTSYSDENLLSSLKDYRDEHFGQKSLSDLDCKKQALENKERKAKELLQQYETIDIQHSNNNEISIDDE